MSCYQCNAFKYKQIKQKRRVYGERKQFPTSFFLSSSLTLQKQFLLNISIFSTSGGNSITLSSMYMNSYFLIHHLQKIYWPLTMENKKLLHIYASPSSLYSPRVLQFSHDYFQFSCYVLLCLWNYALILHFINLSQGDGWWQPVLDCSHTSHPVSFGKDSSLPWVSTSMLLAGQSLHSIFVAMAAASPLGMFPNPGHKHPSHLVKLAINQLSLLKLLSFQR